MTLHLQYPLSQPLAMRGQANKTGVGLGWQNLVHESRNKCASCNGKQPAQAPPHPSQRASRQQSKKPLQGALEASSERVRKAILLDLSKEVIFLLLLLSSIIISTYCMPTRHCAQERGRMPGNYAHAVPPPEASRNWSWWRYHCFLLPGPKKNQTLTQCAEK